LSEGLGAAFVWALEWFLASVDVGVLFEVLSKRKLLEADYANELFGGLVGCQVAAQ
jgi:hypothetical protein